LSFKPQVQSAARDLGSGGSDVYGGLSHIFCFESNSARAFSKITAHCRALRRPVNYADAQIAAIAPVRGPKLATRNVAAFGNCGLNVVDPWNGGEEP
jgi:predicted nucleic acid-binding protein